MSHSDHFDPKLLHKTAHSDLNQCFRLFPVAHSICLYTSRTCKHSLSDCMTRFVRTFDSDCQTFKTAASLNISISKSVDFTLFFCWTDSPRILCTKLPSILHMPFLYLWKLFAIQPTRRDWMKCYKSSRCACSHSNCHIVWTGHGAVVSCLP